MKVLFLISARGTGNGGHFYSLQATATALSSHIECAVANIGRVTSPVLRNQSFPYQDFLYRKLSRKLLSELVIYFEREQPDVLHAFDVPSLYFARWLAQRFKVPILFTKCGGPNPIGYFPQVPEMVLYSAENLDFFESHHRFCRTTLHVLPQRIHEVPQDEGRIARLRQELDPDKAILLRIARIGSAYEYSIMQSIALTKKLLADGLAVQLLVIGVINDQASFARIQHAIKGIGILVTHSDYCHQASQILDIADAVVVTGRGFMEAATRGRILLAPLMQSELPVLVTRQNWHELALANYSPRARLREFNPEENYFALRDVLDSKESAASLHAFSRQLAEEFFLLSNITDQYIAIYHNLKAHRENRIDLALHRLWMVRRDWNNSYSSI